jgi:hypothetical protein
MPIERKRIWVSSSVGGIDLVSDIRCALGADLSAFRVTARAIILEAAMPHGCSFVLTCSIYLRYCGSAKRCSLMVLALKGRYGVGSGTATVLSGETKLFSLSIHLHVLNGATEIHCHGFPLEASNCSLEDQFMESGQFGTYPCGG